MRALILFLIFAACERFATALNDDCPVNLCDEPGICECATNCPFLSIESAMSQGENQYKLYTTFHHPREAFPQLVVVRYTVNNTMSDCSNDLNCNTYIWTSNSIYLVIRPQVIGLLSLFLGVLDDDHTGCVNLTIPEECACWLEFYEEAGDRATLNHLEVLTEKLKIYGQVLSYPQSTSNFQYHSSAVKVNATRGVFHKSMQIDTFLSFMVILPPIATLAFFILILSMQRRIKESMEDPKEHKNYAALIGICTTFSLFAVVMDIVAMFHYNDVEVGTLIYSCDECTANETLFILLFLSIILEGLVIAICDLFPLLGGFIAIGKCMEKREVKYKKLFAIFYKSEAGRDVKYEGSKNVHFCTIISPLIPAVWCLSSRFGFITVAWTSFVRHSTAFTIFYILATFIMFLTMRQIYSLVVRLWYDGKVTDDDIKQIKKIIELEKEELKKEIEARINDMKKGRKDETRERKRKDELATLDEQETREDDEVDEMAIEREKVEIEKLTEKKRKDELATLDEKKTRENDEVDEMAIERKKVEIEKLTEKKRKDEFLATLDEKKTRENDEVDEMAIEREKVEIEKLTQKIIKDAGISLLVIWIIRVFGVLVILFFVYVVLGLWLLPVSEVVEDAPIYLNDSLQLLLVVLAAVISYELYAVKKMKKGSTKESIMRELRSLRIQLKSQGQGSSGGQGAQGSSGRQEAQGSSGRQGAQGSSGGQEAQGSSGRQGAQGSSGRQGAQGSSGRQTL